MPDSGFWMTGNGPTGKPVAGKPINYSGRAVQDPGITPDAGGIYIHIPFCLQKCPYCDFFSVTDRSLVPPFLDAVLHEMDLTSDRHTPFDSLYLGGGTPSILDPEQVARLLAGAHRSYRLLADAETTLEVNPGSVDLERVRGFREAGVNRINIGVQSFRNENLRFLGRIHSAEEAVRTLDRARRAGFDNVGMDLMYGLPDQTEADWLFDLEQAVAQRPEHLSCYMLSYESGTPLERLRKQNRVKPLGDDRVGALFQATIAFLGERGYRHYEVSNFASSSRALSRHNRKYWNFSAYIGLGPSAHSYLPPLRRWNHADVKEYIRELEEGNLPVAGEEKLTRKQGMIEAVYLGLRQTDGMSFDRFEKRFGEDFGQVFGSTLTGLVEEGLICVTSARCTLTLQGMLFLDTVAARLVSEL